MGWGKCSVATCTQNVSTCFRFSARSPRKVLKSSTWWSKWWPKNTEQMMLVGDGAVSQEGGVLGSACTKLGGVICSRSHQDRPSPPSTRQPE